MEKPKVPDFKNAYQWPAALADYARHMIEYVAYLENQNSILKGAIETIAERPGDFSTVRDEDWLRDCARTAIMEIGE